MVIKNHILNMSSRVAGLRKPDRKFGPVEVIISDTAATCRRMIVGMAEICRRRMAARERKRGPRLKRA